MMSQILVDGAQPPDVGTRTGCLLQSTGFFRQINNTTSTNNS